MRTASSYPAIFEKDEGVIYVSFSDIDNCFAQGKDMAKAIEMAQRPIGSSQVLQDELVEYIGIK